MEKVFEADVEIGFGELYEYARIANRRSYGGSYISFYILGAFMLALASADLMAPMLTNWFFVSSAVLLGIFFLLQPGVFIPETVKSGLRRSLSDSPPKKRHLILTDSAVIESPIPGEPPSYTEVNIPYCRLSAVIETENLFLFCIDLSRAVILPKSCVGPAEAEHIRAVSGAKMM